MLIYGYLQLDEANIILVLSASISPFMGASPWIFAIPFMLHSFLLSVTIVTLPFFGRRRFSMLNRPSWSICSWQSIQLAQFLDLGIVLSKPFKFEFRNINEVTRKVESTETCFQVLCILWLAYFFQHRRM